jgi:hypothetical protein
MNQKNERKPNCYFYKQADRLVASLTSRKKRKKKNRCCESGSESGSRSTCLWASWIRIRILLSLSKKKNLDFNWFVSFFYFLPLQDDVKVPSTSIMQKTFFLN